jgi:ribosomal protein S18 acetylase RimI-like enzyme
VLDDAPLPAEWVRGAHRVTTDRAVVTRLLPQALALLRDTHWGGGLTPELLTRAARNSLCFAVVDGPAADGAGAGRLVGFARAVTDLATYAYLTDVVIAPDARGRGLGVWLVRCILAHPELQGLRRVALLTRDAPALYERLGFVVGPPPDRTYMERRSDVSAVSPERSS